MLFGLTNTATTFLEMKYAIIKDMEGCVWYLDDILICSGETKA